MNTAFQLEYMFVRPAALVLTLRRAEKLLCSILCGIIAMIFWIIALICFAAWCLYQTARGTLWLLRMLWHAMTWPIEIVIVVTAEGIWLVWVMLVRFGGQIYWLVVATARVLRRFWGVLWIALRALCIWAIREFGEPTVCAFCVYLGVLSTSLLPVAILLRFTPAALFGLALSPLAAFAIAARVFDIRAYRRWQSGGRTRLGARLLRAYSDGITWGAWLRQRRAQAL